MNDAVKYNWPVAQYKIGEKIRFVNSKKPLEIKEATVTGYDCEDRVMARYELHDGIFTENASVHVNTILPKMS